MTEQTPKSSAFVRFWHGLLRLVLALLIGILLGAGLYFGFLFVYQQLVIPTQQNAIEFQNLNTQVNQQWELLTERNEDLEKRLSVLEQKQESNTNQISELLTEIEQNAANLDAFQIKHDDLVDQHDKYDKLILNLIKQDEIFAANNEDFQTVLENIDLDNKLHPVYQDIAIFKILMQINRSRLFLLQDNYGIAKEELFLADELLNSLLVTSLPDQKDIIMLWDARLNLAINHLPNNPILANDDLEILWKMMANGFTELDESLMLDETNSSEVDNNTSATQTPISPTPSPTPKP
ncbi:MAG: hypothetical protein Q7U53_09940 [Anaerolineaceae bacterium]|nr:hypothetical protein [Anaerolineaceae bacterium]